MKIIDLSHPIHLGMPVFPGTEPPRFEQANTLEDNGFIETKLTIYSHTGTHLDAPAHMRPEGLPLDQFCIDDFIGTAVILDCTFSTPGGVDDASVARNYDKSGLITRQHLQQYKEKISKAQFVIFKTGWSKYWGVEDYYRGFPTLTEEAASWLASLEQLKGIGVDTITIDQMDSTTFPIHHILFAKNLLVVENLCNLDAVTTEYFTFSCLPLKTWQADGSPIRAVALSDDQKA